MIKNHKNKNQYLYVDGLYVRDFTESKFSLDLNNLSSPTDDALFIDNEFENFSQRYSNIDSESIRCPNVAIISDGYDFKNKQKILAQLDKNKVTIIGVNGSLKEWRLVGDDAEHKRAMNFYVVNNPYPDCCHFLPVKHKYWPKCIASSRTNPSFLKRYFGNKYIYSPQENKNYSGLNRQSDYKIDDYRNPICAAINLAWRFGVTKIMLFCCDDSFADERPGAEKLDNGLWCYPQQIVSSKIIDSMLYWLKTKKIDIADHSSGVKLKYATYIETTEDIVRYFEHE